MRDTINARFMERLRRREPLLGTILTLPSPEIAEMMAGAGFDWLFIDLEHGLLDITLAQRMIQAAGPCPCIVRVPAKHGIEIARALDTGAAGVIVPHVNTPQETAAIVQAARFPPEGARSIGVARAQGYGRTLRDTIAHGNRETAVVPQVEHIDGVRRIEEIVAVPGVDAVFIGPFDLSASLGKPGQVADEDVQGGIAAVLEACARASKPCGIFVVDPASASSAFEAGHSLVCMATDTLILGRAAAEMVKAAKD